MRPGLTAAERAEVRRKQDANRKRGVRRCWPSPNDDGTWIYERWTGTYWVASEIYPDHATAYENANA
jgi:hypothetical protein